MERSSLFEELRRCNWNESTNKNNRNGTRYAGRVVVNLMTELQSLQVCFARLSSSHACLPCCLRRRERISASIIDSYLPDQVEAWNSFGCSCRELDCHRWRLSQSKGREQTSGPHFAPASPCRTSLKSLQSQFKVRLINFDELSQGYDYLCLWSEFWVLKSGSNTVSSGGPFHCLLHGRMRLTKSSSLWDRSLYWTWLFDQLSKV